ncbi:MAG TPA: M56 family metallopeptidase [Thermoleophilaceae bacterium]|nr:M56 family metallopeptidase [Thermoleophilaceae bacterium]
MLTELAIAVAIVIAVALPHALPLERVAPAVAAAVWLNALLLRAVVSLGGAVFLFVYLPDTGVFQALARWCLHEVVPLLAMHLGFSGHPLAHAAVVLPAVVLAGSLMWVLVGLARAWMALRRQLRTALGAGPGGSTVIDDDEVVVAVTAVGRPHIVLSAAALSAMDSQELRASVAHERGHLRRRHRPVLLIGSVLAAIARPLPGTRLGEGELGFHLERDADEFAVRETHDPLALASAICKAAQSRALAWTPLAGRGPVTSRLDILVDGGPPRSALVERLAASLAVLLAALTLVIAVTVPAWVTASPAAAVPAASSARCPH